MPDTLDFQSTKGLRRGLHPDHFTPSSIDSITSTMQLSWSSLLTIASAVTAVCADAHTSCWCESDGSVKDKSFGIQGTLTKGACAEYFKSYNFFRNDRPISKAGVTLTVTNYNGFSFQAQNYHWLCVARQNNLVASIIGGNEWSKACIAAAKVNAPNEKGVRGKCPQPGNFPEVP
ncbi:hypothetical protein BDZ85DRAFT_257688 [Elsinoe ampelina]|uniref:Uncharacterized protein n=1 Tax=Elsinoe ampelina TaxID=302913 RepID=A0A6A6GIJ2_9PEZI|nr:hypothetical protein BDZ85DRAFT_257688 [Elsinoe ampelina]